ncbi:MAG: DUF5050 domain-containing protein [Chloroflexi bacterium]|jgi:Tol biopolymer transport system component|nr:DUF5050 domain-containing protein [Chloroflexota bacterium]MBT7081031.1 DUF5050 domain-containing protein [Chloroflexota bacterium]MBT7289204.1 DUF5050 domain-containing protein [Chloroflexota bacterium]
MHLHRIKILIVITALALIAAYGCLGPNGKIAYIGTEESNKELYVMNADGSNKVKIGNASVACISPDSSKIAYFKWDDNVGSLQNDNTGIFVTDTRRQGNTKIAEHEARQLSWSPDGSKIAFVNGDQFLTMNEDGSNITRLSPAGTMMSRWPTWSPDGMKIAFACWSGYPDDLVMGLHTINADGSNLQLVFNTTGNQIGGIAWSPDGNTIAYIASMDKIVTINTDGSDKKTILACADVDDTTSILKYLMWSPDGKRMVFTADYKMAGSLTTHIHICTINTDGSGLKIIADNLQSDAFPSWGS